MHLDMGRRTHSNSLHCKPFTEPHFVSHAGKKPETTERMTGPTIKVQRGSFNER
jgi:hypothetical protein